MLSAVAAGSNPPNASNAMSGNEVGIRQSGRYRESASTELVIRLVILNEFICAEE